METVLIMESHIAESLLAMIKPLILLTALFFGCSIAQKEVLGEFKWKNRVLIVSDSEKKNLSNKIKRDYSMEFEDRDLVVVKVIGNEVFLNGRLASESLSQSILLIVEDSLDSNDLVLIGKDGKVKNRYNSENGINLVFQDIDSMPMRIREMK